jgi:hypothetical protein
MKKSLFLLSLLVCAPAAFATTIIQISDGELYRRADVIVHGTVTSSTVGEDAQGRPETITVVSPMEVVKGALSGNLTLHQLGGQLPDGRSFKIWGRPEYRLGSEVLVFAIARLEGDYQTAELMLGKFEVYKDQQNRRFAIPDFERGVYDGVVIYRGTADPSAAGSRDLDQFVSFLRGGASSVEPTRVAPVGQLTPVDGSSGKFHIQPNWGNMNDQLWRWNNAATAVWMREGTANMTGGGNAEAIAAMATWTNHPNSTINYTDGTSSNFVHLSAASSPCGWNTCFPGSGVIGCGGPNGGGTNVFRGETYNTITGGEVWLRCYMTFDQVGSILTQAVLTHELGHTLGLGHSDQNVSVHDVCRGDESVAIMHSSVPNRTTLGTDDSDAVRWLYGDGGNSCTAANPPTLVSISPTSGFYGGGVTVTFTGTNFLPGTLASLGGVLIPATVVNSTTLTVVSPMLNPGTLNNAAITTSSGNAGLVNAYLSDFLDVPQGGFHNFIEKIFRNGITAGCGGGNYCPGGNVNRDQMAVFILSAKHGPAFRPPAATGTMFGDVPASAFAAAWIEEFAREGITAGCGGGNYCPGSPVLRSQMSVFLLAGKYGSSYAPPPATGTMFTDVPANAFAAAWIEELAREGITAGCGGGNFCPNASTSRGQMAVFLVATFNLP